MNCEARECEEAEERRGSSSNHPKDKGQYEDLKKKVWSSSEDESDTS